MSEVDVTRDDVYNILSVYAIDIALQLDFNDIDNPFSEASLSTNMVNDLIKSGIEERDAVTMGVSSMIFLLLANI